MILLIYWKCRAARAWFHAVSHTRAASAAVPLPFTPYLNGTELHVLVKKAFI